MGLQERRNPSEGSGEVLLGFLRVALAFVVILAVPIIFSDFCLRNKARNRKARKSEMPR